jgi:hypothetical protein
MKKRIVFAGMVIVSLAAGGVSAETLAADLGDVRVYSMGYGAFRVESDRAHQDFPLNFSSAGGWIEIGCSSTVRKVSSDLIGEGVEWVVKTYLAQYFGPTSDAAAKIASKTASWAAEQGIAYLCGEY